MPTVDDVNTFLTTTPFSGYQAVPLPFGLSVPGKDRSRAAETLLGGRIKGKSLLDVGTYYGYFPCYAMQQGATRAVGIEADAERFAIARQIAAFHGNYEIRQGRAESLQLNERFDVVLFLNVIHHVLDPVAVMQNLAAHCRDTLIVEFCLPDDPQYLAHLYSDDTSPLLRKALRRWHGLILRGVCRHLPLMAVGNRDYHRVFYFSQQAFVNLFVLHHKLFSDVKFLPPLSRRRRAVALCTIRK